MSDLGMESKRAEGLGIGGLLTTRKRDSIASRRVLILSVLALTTSRSLAWKRLTRAPKQERSELTMTNKLAIVLNLIPCRLLKRRQARPMQSIMRSVGPCSRVYSAEILSKSASLPLGLYFSKIRPHILNPLCSYAG